MAKLIIFIHGLGSNGTVWNDFIKILNTDVETKHMKLYGDSDIDENESYYVLYEYNSNIVESKVFAKTKEVIKGKRSEGSIRISGHSKTLLSKIRRWEDSFDSIDIVAHSMGGIITMFMLFRLIESNDIRGSIMKCLLYAVPLKGSENPQDLMKFLGGSLVSEISTELLPDSITIGSLHQQLSMHNELLKSKFDIQYVSGDEDARIVPIESDFITNFSKITQIQGDHSSIVKPTQMESDSFYWFKKHIVSNAGKEKKSISILSINEDSVDDIVCLFDREGINYTRGNILGEDTIKVISVNNKKFEEWRIYKNIDNDDNHFIFITDIERSEKDTVDNIKKEILYRRAVNHKDLYSSFETVCSWGEWERSEDGTSNSGKESTIVFNDFLQTDFWKDIIKKSDTFIDLGVGSGVKTTKVLDSLKNNNIGINNKVKIVIVDSSSHMMKIAHKKIRDHLEGSRKFCTTDGLNTDFLTLQTSKACFQGEKDFKSVFFLLGGTFGNINENYFLGSLKSVMNKGDLFILGVFIKNNDRLDIEKEKYDCKRVKLMFSPSLRNLGLNLINNVLKTDWVDNISKISGSESLEFRCEVKEFDSNHVSTIKLIHTTRYDEKKLKDHIEYNGFKIINTYIKNNTAYFSFEFLGG